MSIPLQGSLIQLNQSFTGLLKYAVIQHALIQQAVIYSLTHQHQQLRFLILLMKEITALHSLTLIMWYPAVWILFIVNCILMTL